MKTQEKMTLHNVEQGTQEWFDLKIKYPLSASEGQAIGNQGAGLETLCWEKSAEKYSTQAKQRFTNKDLERGHEIEPLAAEIYELRTGNKVTIIGFVTDESISSVGGASPDRLVNDDGLLEIKAFDDTKHFKCSVEFIKTGTFKIEPQYIWQMQQQMLFTGRQWCDFAAYNPYFENSLLVVRVYRDEEKINQIIEGLKKGEKLLKEIDNIMSK